MVGGAVVVVVSSADDVVESSGANVVDLSGSSVSTEQFLHFAGIFDFLYQPVAFEEQFSPAIRPEEEQYVSFTTSSVYCSKDFEERLS